MLEYGIVISFIICHSDTGPRRIPSVNYHQLAIINFTILLVLSNLGTTKHKVKQSNIITIKELQTEKNCKQLQA